MVFDYSSVLMMKYEEEEEVVQNGWSSELPTDLLWLIADKVRSLSFSEFIKFGSVCIDWRFFCIENYQPIKIPSKLPMLLIPHPSFSNHHQITSPPPSIDVGVDQVEQEEQEEEEDNNGRFKKVFNWEDYYSTRNFYTLYEKRVYQGFPLPVSYDKNIRGSSHGWLVSVEHCCSNDGVHYYPVQLFNPFRPENYDIQLPPLNPSDPSDSINTSYYLVKAYLSANPSSLSDPTTELVVLGINMYSKLSFCRPIHKVWTYINYAEQPYHWIQDIICYQGQFYAILRNGFVFAFIVLDDAAQLHPTFTVTVKLLPPQEDSYPPPHRGYIMRYLVESAGELFQIRRDAVEHSNYFSTVQFLVYKLDPTDPTKWVETKTLNDLMFFLGNSFTSMSLSALDFPWCKPNSIYYTDDAELIFVTYPGLDPHDIGVFNIEDKSFEPFDTLELKTMPPPIWIQPML